jgi:hypothetical protein
VKNEDGEAKRKSPAHGIKRIKTKKGHPVRSWMNRPWR